jgi:hypothetical protein
MSVTNDRAPSYENRLASDGKRQWCASCGVAEGGVMVDAKTFGKPPVYAAGQKRARAVAK